MSRHREMTRERKEAQAGLEGYTIEEQVVASKFVTMAAAMRRSWLPFS
jgi:hypothetical protein